VAPDTAEKKKLLEEPLQSLSQGERMTPGKMLLILREVAPDIEQNGNQMFFKIAEYPVILIYDNSADRMRLVVPIMTEADLKKASCWKPWKPIFIRYWMCATPLAMALCFQYLYIRCQL